MTGFGGLLGVLRKIGGGFLWALLGSKAWSASEKAQNFQLGFGSLIFGFVIGFILYRWCLNQTEEGRVISFLATPAASLVVAFILNAIRKSIASAGS